MEEIPQTRLLVDYNAVTIKLDLLKNLHNFRPPFNESIPVAHFARPQRFRTPSPDRHQPATVPSLFSLAARPLSLPPPRKRAGRRCPGEAGRSDDAPVTRGGGGSWRLTGDVRLSVCSSGWTWEGWLCRSCVNLGYLVAGLRTWGCILQKHLQVENFGPWALSSNPLVMSVSKTI